MQEWAPLGEGADEIYANDLCRLSLVELGSDGAFAATFGASKARRAIGLAALSAIRLSGTPVLLVNVGMDETADGGPAAKQLECCMGADAGDDALTHVVSLPSLLPAAPPDDGAAAAKHNFIGRHHIPQVPCNGANNQTKYIFSDLRSLLSK